MFHNCMEKGERGEGSFPYFLLVMKSGVRLSKIFKTVKCRQIQVISSSVL